MKVSGAGISTIANVRDRFALLREMAFGQTVRISIQVCVVIDKLTISAQLINGRATAFALKEFLQSAPQRRYLATAQAALRQPE